MSEVHLRYISLTTGLFHVVIWMFFVLKLIQGYLSLRVITYVLQLICLFSFIQNGGHVLTVT